MCNLDRAHRIHKATARGSASVQLRFILATAIALFERLILRYSLAHDLLSVA